MAPNKIPNKKGFEMHENALTQTLSLCTHTKKSSPETFHFSRYAWCRRNERTSPPFSIPLSPRVLEFLYLEVKPRQKEVQLINMHTHNVFQRICCWVNCQEQK